MNNLKICRICTCYADPVFSIDLFNKKRNSLLLQITDITGCLLKNEEILPRHICLKCQENLQIAKNFRKLCLDSQSYFSSDKYKKKFQKQSNTKNINENKAENCAKEDQDEGEYPVVIKSEASSMDESENDVLETTKEKRNNVKNISLENESNYPPDLINLKSKDLGLQKGSSKRGVKRIQKDRTKKANSLVDQKSSAIKARKPEEKIELICDQCGNQFNCRHHFITHLRRHTNEKPFKCEVCPDKFYTHSELKRHMRRHTGERPFACKHCERRFTDYSTRIKHERTHTNERPYMCLQCGKAFTNSYVLKNHMLVHTGERSFKCSLCNRAFQRQTHLTVHYRSIMHKQMVEKQQITEEPQNACENKPLECVNTGNNHRPQ